MTSQVPYNTGKVLIGSNLPLPQKHYTMSDDALRLQTALLRRQASPKHRRLMSQLSHFLKGTF